MCDDNGSDQDGETASNGGDPSSGGGPVTGGIELGEIFDCLTSSHRRHVLYYMQENQVATLEEAAREIAAWEEDIPPENVGDDRQHDISIELMHKHLPKLADAYLIEYDARSSTIRSTELPRSLSVIIDRLEDFERYSRNL